MLELERRFEYLDERMEKRYTRHPSNQVKSWRVRPTKPPSTLKRLSYSTKISYHNYYKGWANWSNKCARWRNSSRSIVVKVIINLLSKTSTLIRLSNRFSIPPHHSTKRSISLQMISKNQSARTRIVCKLISTISIKNWLSSTRT